jgi:transcriptional regulator with XRE-family HTH domain
MSTPSDIGTRIRAARRDRGLTQDELADHVGVSRSAVAQWETGRTGQVTGNLSRIASVLEVNVEYLMHGEDKRAAGEVRQGDELALLRLYRECDPEDRQMLLRTARRLAQDRPLQMVARSVSAAETDIPDRQGTHRPAD